MQPDESAGAVALLRLRVGELESSEQECRRALLEVREREQVLRQLTESAREVFWLTDWVANKVLYVSPAYEKVWGRPAASLHARPVSWIEVIHPEDVERVYHAFKHRMPLGEYDIEYRLLRDDGSVVWIRDRAVPIRDRAGRLARVAGVSEDITSRKLAELELAATRARLEEMVAERTSSLARANAELQAEMERRERGQAERESLIEELTRALGKVKTLSGLLPICAHCKKIRDDTGFWHQVEQFLLSRTDAAFSHSICPECLRKHYPEVAEEDEAERQGT